MMRSLIFLLLVVFRLPALAQEHWAVRVGAWSNDAFNDVVIDGAGQTFAVGEFGGTIPLSVGTITSNGSLDAMVAKYNANGDLLWIRRFGGLGLDRASAVALGPNGELVVVGQFMGTVELDGQTLTSQGGSQDVFILRIDPQSGSVLWAKQGGSADEVDQPNAVSVGPDGSVVVTGEFRSTAVFDAGTLTSMTDPLTGLPSVDIFVAAYAANGDALWLKHGAAKFADRGLAVAHDPAGNVYVTGQFSDTLTIDQTHFNQMFSAVFIVRFAPDGEEEWFRAFGGGTYNQVFALTMIEEARLMLVGDVQGTVIFLDNEPDLFTATEPRSSFLVEVGFDGEFIRQTTWGSQHVVNTRALSVKDDEVAVYGRFQCQFTGFSALYGEGTWLATGQHDLYVARFELEDLQLKDAQQFGGQRNKVPGGIGHLPNGELVFGGSYDRLLVFPSTGAEEFTTYPAFNGVTAPSVPSPFCDDDHYGSYVGLRGSSLMDAFLAKGFVEGRRPYDIFARSDGPCERPQGDVRIVYAWQGQVGPDSLSFCNQGSLSVHTNTAFSQDTSVRHTAPHLQVLWNTGDTTTAITVNTSGWYHVLVTSQAGCWQRYDSLYITVHPLPAIPLISDDVVVNTTSPAPLNISVCAPQQPWLWVTGMDPVNSVQWSGPPGVVQGDSIHATLSGPYGVSVSTPQGCLQFNLLNVTILPNAPVPALDAQIALTFPQDTDMDDTVRICMNVQLSISAAFQLFNGGQPFPLPPGLKPMVRLNDGGWSNAQNAWPTIAWQQQITEEGWYVFDMDLLITNAPCGEDTVFFDLAPDSIYVIPYPVLTPNIAFSGPLLLCPGTTATIELTCTNCSTWNWSGPHIVTNLQDQVVVDGPGLYYVYAQYVDTNGCTTYADSYHGIQWNPNPLLSLIPSDGIICPDSTATIFTTAQGSDFQWYGPLGPLGVDNDSLVTSQPGLYYLEMVDMLGCPVTSNVALINDFATPFLNVLPDNVLCEPGETTTLQVVTTGQSSLQWWAPLSGSALQQIVDQPGIYTCSVNACGITHVLSVEVFGNNAQAALPDPGPFTICPDDDLLLTAPSGNAVTYWLPGPVFAPQFAVPGAGTFTLVAIDPNGCQQETHVVVDVLDWTETISVSDTAVCLGTPVVLTAAGSGVISWFADEGMSTLLANGPILDLGVPQESMTVYAQQEEGTCTSDANPLSVLVVAPPTAPEVLAPDSVCAGTDLVLAVQQEPGVNYSWTTPAGTVQGAQVALNSVGPSAAGSYMVNATAGGCSSMGLPHLLTVLVPQPLSIGADTLICPGGMAIFQVPDDFASPVWHDGGTDLQYVSTTSGTVWLHAEDTNGCLSSDTADVQVFTFAQPLVTSSSTICFGASTTLLAMGSGTLTWYADTELTQAVHTGASWSLASPPVSAIYHITQAEGPCVSNAQPLELVVLPMPMDAVLLAPSAVCESTELLIQLQGSEQPTGYWTTPMGPFMGPQVFVPEATEAHAGTYMVVPAIGPCLGDTLWATVQLLVPQPLFIGSDTTFCQGGWIVLEVPSGFSDPLWSTGAQTSVIEVVQPGTYGLWATDVQGCVVYDEVVLNWEPCDPVMPNVITPNGDGANDLWSIDRGTVRSAQLTVYNRYGAVVWEGDPSIHAFSGIHGASGEPLSEGTYYYVLRLFGTDGSNLDHTGYLQLIR
ncbi:MAG: gliding motility-associated C-terminal domain-containing protein [Flavobacteriales bacterium]|nr:gliding motility-associated C-terminal domain-containing protein [Flavobacteriales bacterium]